MRLEEEIKQRKFKNEKQKLMINQLFTGRWVANAIADYLKPFGLTSQQYNVLRILRGQESDLLSISGIAERMIDKMSNVSRLIERLKSKGLVSRKVNLDDRRQVDVGITDEGLDLLKKLDGMDDEIEKLFDNISEAEAGKINNLLDKMRG